MKVILWATLTANGNYARSDETHPPFPEALADFGSLIHRTGCFIVGRTTFEGFRASGAKLDPSIQIVVISKQNLTIPGVDIVRSPQEALNVLSEKGFETVALAGGAQIHASFLQQNLVDELVINIAPVLEDEGYKILLQKGAYKHLELVQTTPLSQGLVQLHYSVNKNS